MWKRSIRIGEIGLAMLLLAGCSASKPKATDQEQQAAREQTEQELLAEQAEWDSLEEYEIRANGTVFQAADASITVEENVVTITEEGSYVVSGTMENGQIHVLAAKGSKVEIVLQNADITCSFGAPIYVENAGKVTVTVAEGTMNRVYQTSDYQGSDAESEEDQKAAIYSKDDLVIAGNGTLRVTGDYCHGIRSKDTLTLREVNCEIVSKEDALNCNEELKVLSGAYRIQAGDDALHSDTDLTIDDGNIQIDQCYEGLEGANITINGGQISLVAKDDGINAASKDKQSPLVTIHGGKLYMIAGGDGLDSNGDVIMSGGYVEIYGPTTSNNGSIDYDKSFVMTGGTIVAAGHSAMAQAISDTSTQPGLMVYTVGEREAQTAYEIKDSAGNTVVSANPMTKFLCVYVSCPQFTLGETYSVWFGGEKTCEVTLTGINTWIKEDGQEIMPQGGYQMGRPGGGGGGRQEGFGGERPEGFDGKRPEDFGGEWPEGFDGKRPEDFDGEWPEGFDGKRPENFDGERPDRNGRK